MSKPEKEPQKEIKVSKEQKALVLVRMLGITDRKEIKKILRMKKKQLNKYMYENYKDKILQVLQDLFADIMGKK